MNNNNHHNNNHNQKCCCLYHYIKKLIKFYLIYLNFTVFRLLLINFINKVNFNLDNTINYL